jgi:hypothetical protein
VGCEIESVWSVAVPTRPSAVVSVSQSLSFDGLVYVYDLQLCLSSYGHLLFLAMICVGDVTIGLMIRFALFKAPT